MTDAIKFGFPYPNILNSTTLVSSINDSQTGEFTGLKYNLHLDTTLVDRVPTTIADWTNYPEPENDTSTIVINASQEITATNNSTFNSLLYTKYPISLKSGVFKFSAPASSGWYVGLTNAGIYEDFIFSSNFNHPLSELNFTATRENDTSQMPPTQGARKQLRNNFIDFGCYSVGAVGGGGNIFLEIFYMTYDTDKPTHKKMVVIDYYSQNNNISKSRYQITANTQNIQFITEGEEVRVQVEETNGSGTITKLLVSQTINSGKKYNLKPILQECWNLHPIVGIKDTLDPITILRYDGLEVENYDIYDSDKIKKSNLFHRYVLNGKMTEYRRLHDLQFNILVEPSYTRILNVNASSGGYSPALILAPQDGRITAQARGMDTLGFNVSIVDSFSASGSNFSINGTKANKISSKSNLFVRLDNFTQLSYNAGIGRQSKIIYALPRFSNSGEDTGSLFFEATEKTYIDLNNAEDILANDFDLSIVQEDETLADLTGKSIIVLYFRQKQ